MDEDLLARFLPQFLTLARSRVSTAIAKVAGRDPADTTKIIRELHTLAGEAGLLGLSELVPLARDCEKRAKELNGSRADTDAELLVAALRQLEKGLDGIAARPPKTAGD